MARELSRRAFALGTLLGTAGCDRALSALASLAGGGVPEHFEVPTGQEVDADSHLLARATFGPRPGDLDALRQIGRRAWIDEQLAPERIDDLACDLRVGAIDTLHVDASLSFEFPPEQIEEELARGAVLSATYSRLQLREVLTEAWADHFHVSIGKGRCRHLRSPYQREVLRRYALGRFRDLLGAVTRSAAMLEYLDGAANERGEAPNENHARELLELHTLGVTGGYEQRDVEQIARCLTGFVIEERGARPGSVTFVPARHDDGPKTVLGHQIGPGGGAGDVERVLDIVSEHPSTARRVAAMLARTFVADEPPESVVSRAADTFTRSGGEIAAVVRAILGSDEFFASRGDRIKRPFRFVVSALRALGAESQARGDVLPALARMGHAPFAWPTPDGYPSRGDAWLGTMLERFRFALALAFGRVDGTRVAIDDLRRAAGGDDALLAHLLGRRPSDAEQAAFAASPDLPGKIALAIAGPAFQRF